MTAKNFLFTSESVTEGHPDKICDQISDAILDEFLTKDNKSRVAAETTVTTGMALVCGEITSDCYVDIPAVVRQTIKNRISLSENIDEMLRKEKSDMLDNKTASSIRTFKDIVDGKEVSENDNHLLERHINELMGKMHNQTITPEQQMLLDEYIAFKQNADLQNSYSQNVEAMNAAKNADYHKEYPNGKVLKLEPRKNDQSGFVSIIAIFASVILLGILLGAVIITLAFK